MALLFPMKKSTNAIAVLGKQMKKGIMNNNWEKQEYSSKGYGDFKVERILYVDNAVKCPAKFFLCNFGAF